MSYSRRAILAGALLCAVSAPAWSADQTCYEDWADAAVTVAKEQLVTVEALLGRFTEAKDGKVVRTVLCLENGRYVYKVVLRAPGGRLRSLAVDARHPAAR